MLFKNFIRYIAYKTMKDTNMSPIVGTDGVNATWTQIDSLTDLLNNISILYGVSSSINEDGVVGWNDKSQYATSPNITLSVSYDTNNHPMLIINFSATQQSGYSTTYNTVLVRVNATRAFYIYGEKFDDITYTAGQSITKQIIIKF